MQILMGLTLIVYIILCLGLIFFILIQSGKGGGLSSLGGASEALSESLGATGAEKTLTRITTFSAVGFMVLAIVLALMGSAISDGQLLDDSLAPTAVEQVEAPSAPEVAIEAPAVEVPALPEAPAAE